MNTTSPSPHRVINDDVGSRPGRALADMTINMLQQQVHNLLMRRNDLFSTTLDAKHKINQDCGYPEKLDITHYVAMYDREGVGARVVHLMPDESWKDDPEVIESQDTAKVTAFEKKWIALERHIKFYNLFHRVDRLSGLGSFGTLLLGVDDGKALNEPIDGVEEAIRSLMELETEEGAKPQLATKRKLLYVRPLSEEHVSVSDFETDNTNWRFGLPVLYEVKFNEMNKESTSQQVSPQLQSSKVHWTRMIHVADDMESSEVFGVPRQKRVFNRLFDIRKICGGSGEMFWRGGFPGINFKVDPVSKGARSMTEEERTALQQEVTDYISGLQRYIATEGMTAESISPQVADPSAHFEMNLKAIAVSIGCPYRIFTGTEEGKLAGGQDSKAWNTRVNRRRSKHCTHYIIRPTIDRLMLMQILPWSSTYFVSWTDLNTVDEQQKAQNAQHLATALSIYVSSGADAVIPPEQFLAHILGFNNDVVETIMDAVNEWVRNLETKIEDEAKIEAEQRKVDAQIAKARIAGPKPNGRPTAKAAASKR